LLSGNKEQKLRDCNTKMTITKLICTLFERYFLYKTAPLPYKNPEHRVDWMSSFIFIKCRIIIYFRLCDTR
jgi:hypothetical protein